MTKPRKSRTVVSLLLDVGVPVGSYYLLKGAFGMSAVAALGWSSAGPVLRTGWGVLRQREVNVLPLLILLANLAGLLIGFGTGDARLMLAKDSAVTSLVGFALLGSVALGRPMMTATRAELRFSAVWGVAFVGECGVRIVRVYALPVDTMVWLGTVVMIVTMLVAFVVSGALGAGPMVHMIGAAVTTDDSADAFDAVLEAEKNSSLVGSTHG